MSADADGMHAHGWLQRAARAVCPRADRDWVDAMFAELDAIEDSRRASWTAGAGAIVFSGIRLRMATVPVSILFAMLVTLGAVVLFGLASRSEVEALLMDDDVFLRFAWVSAALLLVLGVLAITWIFNHTDAKPRHRH